jgi:hypothetical protein
MAADAASQFQKIQIQREDTVTTPPSLHPHLFSCLSDSPLTRSTYSVTEEGSYRIAFRDDYGFAQL